MADIYYNILNINISTGQLAAADVGGCLTVIIGDQVTMLWSAVISDHHCHILNWWLDPNNIR